jgi:uncharacterized coiled-coil protein SlyX
MKCPDCHFESKLGSKYCPQCGKEIYPPPLNPASEPAADQKAPDVAPLFTTPIGSKDLSAQAPAKKVKALRPAKRRGLRHTLKVTLFAVVILAALQLAAFTAVMLRQSTPASQPREQAQTPAVGGVATQPPSMAGEVAPRGAAEGVSEGLDEAIVDKQQKVEKLDETIAEKKKKVAELEKAIALDEGKLKGLKKEVALAENMLKELKAEIAQSESRLKTLNTQAARSKRERTANRVAAAREKHRLEGLTTKVAATERKLKGLNADVAHIERRVTKLSREMTAG